MYNKLDKLVGKSITSVSINGDKTYIVFHTNEGDIAYFAEGECCSRSWIEHISNVKALIGSTILETTEDEVGELGDRDNFEVTVLYGYTLKTTNGDVTIDFRNESNGYYGGSLDLVEDPNELAESWKQYERECSFDMKPLTGDL